VNKSKNLNTFFLTSIFFLAISFLLYTSNWKILQYWGIAGGDRFIDLGSVLSSADCFSNIGFKIYDYPIGHACAYNYGSFLMQTLNLLQLGSGSKIIIGIFFIFAICAIFSITASITGKKYLLDYAYLALLLFSPPILLLMERGNLDSLILIMTFLIAVLVSSNKNTLAILISFVGALYKFYPLILVPLLTLDVKKWLLRVFYAVLSVLVVIQIFYDIQRGPGFINTSYASFGAPIFGLYLTYVGVGLSYTSCVILGWVISLIATIMMYLFYRRTGPLIQTEKVISFKNSTQENFYLIFISLHIFCFLLGMNFDYRLIFLVIANLFLVYGANLNKSDKRMLRIIQLLSLWLSYNQSVYIQPIGDVLILLLSSYNFLVLLQIILPKLNSFKSMAKAFDSLRYFIGAFIRK
jgi:hypothetical protein